MLDKVKIKVQSGDGGGGAVTFHREKFVPRGGPDGGDGGRGGDVIIKADANLSHLSNCKKQFKAEDGGKGQRNNRTGKSGANLVLAVPVGTVVAERDISFDSLSITDLSAPEQSVVVARGGGGGRGNAHFVSSTNQVPRLPNSEAGRGKGKRLEPAPHRDAGIIGTQCGQVIITHGGLGGASQGGRLRLYHPGTHAGGGRNRP
jgi:GTP-binding protein